jgi:hypothetical protein
MTIQSEVRRACGPQPCASTAAILAAMNTNAGLCDTCLHQRIVRNTRGSVFSLCERSKTDPAYPKYPRVPVAACPGYDPRQCDSPSEPSPSPPAS